MALRTMYTKAVFLDKDGTLVENVPYNANPEKIQLINGVLEGLKLLHEAGYKLIVITNQAGVAYGYFQESALEGVQKQLSQLFQAANVPLTAFYYCPHHPDGVVARYSLTCFCRKPNPGLLFRAAREHQLSLSDSWFIGDILDDVEAGRRADCRTILVENGTETVWRKTPIRRPNLIVKSFLDAAQAIYKSEGNQKQVGLGSMSVTIRTIPINIPKNGSAKSTPTKERVKKGEYAGKSNSSN